MICPLQCNCSSCQEISEKTIWNFRQNHPELVVRDLQEHFKLSDEDCEVVRRILLARGVNKWLKVRRDLIAFKKQLRNLIKAIECEREALWKGHPRRRQLLEKSKAPQYCRSILKKLCMTDRMQVWPVDRSISEGLRSMNTLRAAD